MREFPSLFRTNPETGDFPNRPFLNFYKLTPAQQAEFSRRTERFNGVIRIFIHPFYDLSPQRSYESILPPDQASQAELVRQGLSAILSKPPENTPPVLVFEEYSHLGDKPYLMLATATTSKNFPYLVPTLKKTSVPLKRKWWKPVFNLQQLKKSFGELADQLERYGARSIIIGGLYLNILGSDVGLSYESRFNRPRGLHYVFPGAVRGRNVYLYLTDCVGLAAEQFSQRFPVYISHFAYPKNRTDVGRILETFKNKNVPLRNV